MLQERALECVVVLALDLPGGCKLCLIVNLNSSNLISLTL
uniref:Uncharacterized protein n=1 Tax=Solanum lycopersicum TaxID=4081 RepID=A0A3Q7IGH4_SOLLC